MTSVFNVLRSPVLLLALSLPVFAGSISLNFEGADSSAATANLLAPGDIAGVVPAANWNNASGTSGSSGNLNDDSGAATTMDVSWTAQGTWSWERSGDPVPANANGVMFNGYLDTTGNDGSHTISVTNVPYARYDVIVYIDGENNGSARPARVNVNPGASGDNPALNVFTAETANWNNTFVQAVATTAPGTTAANYARFTGLTSTNFDIYAEAETFRAAINGFQVVETAVTPGLPEIANLAPLSVATDSAAARANLINNGDGAESAAVTFYWGTSDGGSTAAAWSNSLSAGSFTAPESPVTASLNSLLPNTTYYYRAFVLNSQGSDWAPESETFTTATGAPSVSNSPASDLLATSATVGGTVTSTGGETPNVRVYYGDNDGDTVEGSWDAFVDLGIQGGAFSTGLSSLSGSTGYFFRCRAVNSGGAGWAASSGSFTTATLSAPAVVTRTATNITGNSATLNGSVTDDGGDTPVVGFYYGRSDGGTVAGNWDLFVQIGPDSNDFSRGISNLDALSTYYFRAFATNAAGSVWAPTTGSFSTPAYVAPTIVINELHIDEDDKTRKGEFIELYNNSDTMIDLSGWYFSNGVNQADGDFTIPGGTTLGAGEFLVIAQDPAEVEALFGYVGALGPWTGKLSNKGETVTLNDASGNVIDEVSYKLGWPWPTVGDDPSPSMELIHPDLDNDLGGSWRSSGNVPASSGAPANFILRNDSNWRYRKGFTFPANDGDGNDWTENGYDDSVDGQWLTGQAPFGFGDGDDNTLLNDMEDGYITTFLRHEFTIAPGGIPNSLQLRALYDDGLVVWINGEEVHRYSVDAGAIAFPPPAGFANNHEAGTYEEVSLAGVASYLVEGTNTIAVQLINASIGSSDATADVEVVFDGSSGGGAGSEPTPGAVNSVTVSNAPPAMRQVEHSPEQPTSNSPVTITTKVTDTNGVGSVTLSYQLVDPGDYIKISDSRYLTEWTDVAMVDDGSAGDAFAGDDVYTAVLPAGLQTHRRLVRYRISSGDTLGASVTGPYSDDPQPNFAYYVYDTMPAWSASASPGAGVVDYDFNNLPSLQQQVPVYQLITTREEHEDAQHIPDSNNGSYGGSDYLWEGSLVYDGRVYDHIRFRARGGVWRYAMGKNMWKFDFNRGHRFEAYDNHGRRYDADWSKLNFSALIQQGNFNQRGEQGLFEWGGFKLHNLAGNPSPRTHFVHFRIVSDANEEGPTASQFDTDFQGLYLAVEQMDGQFLEEHGLEDGNLYKMEGGSGVLNNQGPDQPSDKSDLNAFFAYKSAPQSQQWWEDNLNLPDYYNFRAISTAIHDYDIHAGKNYFYFHDPADDKWRVLNWDLDLTWTTTYNGGGGRGPLSDDVLALPNLKRDYQNRMREILSLLFNDDQTGKVLDECARFIYTPGMASLADADRAMWDYNPILTSGYVNSSKAGHGRFYQAASPATFAGMIDHVKGHISDQTANPIKSSSNHLAGEDAIIPAKPMISYTGDPGYPANNLTFQSSSFTDPQGDATFAGMQWRIGEVYHEGISGYLEGDPYRYEIEDVWTSEILDSFVSTQTIPMVEARPGRTYRARVRHLDSSGNWSYWSEPVEFTVTEPDVTLFQGSLVIAEFMYHPIDASAAEIALGFTDSDFEWIELRNVGISDIDLTGVRFTKGVDFDFPEALVIPAGGYVMVVHNQAAFEHRYGNTHPIAGEFGPDKLSNDGENLKLSFGAGTPIIEFTYNDKAPWPEAADGSGSSLVLIDPESLPDHTLPVNWKASTEIGGSPGPDPEITYASWQAANGVVGGPDDDDDNDGVSNLMEYATGSNGNDPDSKNLPIGAIQTIDGLDYLTLTFRKLSGTIDLTYTVEYSHDLDTWDGLDGVLQNTIPNGDGTSTEMWRSIDTIPDEARNFVRLRVELTE